MPLRQSRPARRGTIDSAYGPLVAELERQLREKGLVSDAGPPSAERKRALLQLARTRLGPRFLPAFARDVVRGTGHPFVRALLAAQTPARMLLQWQRLEVLAHSTNRVRTVQTGPREVRLVRSTVGGGIPTRLEDELVLALLCAVIEALGATNVRVLEVGATSTGRRWEVRWKGWEAKPSRPALEPWGPGDDFARAAFALLLEDEGTSLSGLARRLAVSRRTLQRRLREAGTAFRLLVRSARLARAGHSLVDQRSRASLTSVAHACGFADSAHLSREFRSLVGIAPRQFRRSLRG
jgi:AraC-like DNA-binding protein